MKTLFVHSTLATAFTALLAAAAFAQTSTPAPATPAAKRPAPAQNPGERKFMQNCARCHNPPEVLSPRIAGTVLLHMRTRALLSPQDEKDILHFLAP